MKDRKYSAIYRLMHWAIAICMILILGTALLRMGWLNNRHMAAIIENYLSTTDQSLSRGHVNSIVFQIREPMWVWHYYIGYVLIGLFAVRFTLPFFGKMKFSNPLGKELTFKEKLHYWTYIIFYVFVVVSLISGLFTEFGPRNDLRKIMKSIHLLSLYYLLGFIFIHFAGVLMAEMTDQHGIISRLVNGKEKLEN